MSVNVAYTSKLSTDETLTTNAGHQSAPVITAALSTALLGQTGSSTPPCTVRAGADLAMTSGAVTLDLTAMTGTNGVAVSANTLRVQFAKFLNPGTNANAITVAQGASNGYDGFGASFSITLAPGAEVLVRTVDGGSDVGSSNKTLDISGTGAQALSYEIVAG